MESDRRGDSLAPFGTAVPDPTGPLSFDRLRMSGGQNLTP